MLKNQAEAEGIAFLQKRRDMHRDEVRDREEWLQRRVEIQQQQQQQQVQRATCSYSFGLSCPRTFSPSSLCSRFLLLIYMPFCAHYCTLRSPHIPLLPLISHLLKIKSKPSAAYLKARAAVDAHECIWTGIDGTVNGFY